MNTNLQTNASDKASFVDPSLLLSNDEVSDDAAVQMQSAPGFPGHAGFEKVSNEASEPLCGVRNNDPYAWFFGTVALPLLVFAAIADVFSSGKRIKVPKKDFTKDQKDEAIAEARSHGIINEDTASRIREGKVTYRDVRRVRKIAYDHKPAPALLSFLGSLAGGPSSRTSPKYKPAVEVASAMKHTQRQQGFFKTAWVSAVSFFKR